MSAADRAGVRRRHEVFRSDLAATGGLLNGAGPAVAYPRDATTLRWRPDGPAATDAGPFVAAAEQLTAYYVIDCASRERTRSIAARVLDFHVVAVEAAADP